VRLSLLIARVRRGAAGLLGLGLRVKALPRRED
jgi:hypothetical protein